MAYVGKITAGSNEDMLIGSSLFGYCETAAATAAKTVTISGFDVLMPGITIHVLFKYSNTAASPTLNVSGLGAKPIYAYGSTVVGKTVHNSWQANGIVALTYSTNVTSTGAWVYNNYIGNSTYSVYDKALKFSDGTTTLNAITVNSSADRTATFNAGAGLTRSVGGSANAVTVTYTHASPGTGTAISATAGEGTGVTFVDTVSLSKDDLGHVTAFSATTHDLTKADITGLGIPGSDTTYTVGTTSVGSASAGTAIAADDITAWTTNTVPSLTTEDISIGSASGWSAGTAASASVSGGIITITNGTAPSLTVTSKTVKSVKSWSAGTATSLSYTARSIPNISVTSKTVVNSVTAN